MADNKALFLNWLKKNEPVIYAAAVKQAGNSGGMAGWLDDVVDSVSAVIPKVTAVADKIAPTVLKYKLQKEQVKQAKAGNTIDANAYAAAQLATLKEQLARAQNNLPPAQTNNYQPQIVPVQSGVPVNAYANKVSSMIGGVDMKILLPSALLLAVALMMRKKR